MNRRTFLASPLPLAGVSTIVERDPVLVGLCRRLRAAVDRVAATEARAVGAVEAGDRPAVDRLDDELTALVRRMQALDRHVYRAIRSRGLAGVVVDGIIYSDPFGGPCRHMAEYPTTTILLDRARIAGL
jgi:hypothetical protein